MTLFVDASVFVAIINVEAGSEELQAALQTDSHRLTNAVAIWEAARALGRTSPDGIDGGRIEVDRYCTALGIVIVPIGIDEAAEAVAAHARYGKGTGHPARLNMGDCFAYACARTNDARLLYKGDDFIHTDLG